MNVGRMGPYYDHISLLLLWRGRHPLHPRASLGDRSRRSWPDPDLQSATSLRERVLELIRKLMDLGQGGELSAPGSSQGGRDGRSKRYHR